MSVGCHPVFLQNGRSKVGINESICQASILYKYGAVSTRLARSKAIDQEAMRPHAPYSKTRQDARSFFKQLDGVRFLCSYFFSILLLLIVKW